MSFSLIGPAQARPHLLFCEAMERGHGNTDPTAKCSDHRACVLRRVGEQFWLYNPCHLCSGVMRFVAKNTLGTRLSI